MPRPIEALDRPTLERRYRRMRLATVVLAAVSILLVTAVSTQGFRGEGVGSGSGAATETIEELDGADPDGTDAATALQNCPVQDRRDPNDSRGIGAIDAPIVLHEWTDFRCPYCGAFSRDTLPTLMDEYVATGKVRLEIHDAALVGGENSVLLAVAARAAGEQGLYFEYYDAIYQASAKSDAPKAEFSVEQLIELASAVGVPDIDRFTADLSNESLRASVEQETREAQQIGVTGVPFFSTSGCAQVASGAQPVDSFRQMLDTAIADAVAREKQ